MFESKYWRQLSASVEVSSLANQINSAEDSLRYWEQKGGVWGAVFTCWKAELRERARGTSLEGQVEALPTESKEVALYRRILTDLHKKFEEAKKTLEAIQAEPEPEPMVWPLNDNDELDLTTEEWNKSGPAIDLDLDGLDF
jgi:hypothetical protein